MLDLETPRIPRSNSLVHWDRVQVAIRQRAPTGTLHRDYVRSETTMAVDGRWLEFHRVFSPREKNQKVLDFAANAIRSFRNGIDACILGFGQHDSGVSWTLGTNPTSNGLVPSIFRYLREEKLTFKVMAQWVPASGTSPAVEHSPALGTWQPISDRQVLKQMLQDVSPPPETHLIIWFSVKNNPTARLAVVDLCRPHYPLVGHLRQGLGDPKDNGKSHDEMDLCRPHYPLVGHLRQGLGDPKDNGKSHDEIDQLTSHLCRVTGPRAAIVAIGCISDSASAHLVDSSLNYALSLAGRLPLWASRASPVFDWCTPDEPLDSETPVKVTPPTTFGDHLVPQKSQATISLVISDIMQEHATISADLQKASPSHSAADIGVTPEQYFITVQKCRTYNNYV